MDVWSCGVVLYALLCGSLPFDDENVPNLFRKIKHGNFTLPGHLTNEAKDLIVQMLVVDPTKRITFAQIRGHKWFRVNLPEYLAVGPVAISRTLKTELDLNILKEMQGLGLNVMQPNRSAHSAYALGDRKTMAEHAAGRERDRMERHLRRVSSMRDLTGSERVVYHLLLNRSSRQSSFSDILPAYAKHGGKPPVLVAEEATVGSIRPARSRTSCLLVLVREARGQTPVLRVGGGGGDGRFLRSLSGGGQWRGPHRPIAPSAARGVDAGLDWVGTRGVSSVIEQILQTELVLGHIACLREARRQTPRVGGGGGDGRIHSSSSFSDILSARSRTRSTGANPPCWWRRRRR